MPDLNPHREKAEKIFRHSLESHNPARVVSGFILGNKYLLPADSHIDLVATGKSGPAMARGALAVLGDGIERGLVITNAPGGELPGRIRIIHSSHPVPDDRSLESAVQLMEFVSSAGDDSTLLYLMSGGTSAMVALPEKGISLDEKRELTSVLLNGGIEIGDLNLVRSFFSGIKGGKLSNRIKAQNAIALVISDVLTNDLSTIGSGVLYPRPVDPREVVTILEKYGVQSNNPVVAKCIGIAKRGNSEVPAHGMQVEHYIIDSNESFVNDLSITAEKEGYKTFVSPKPFTGDVGRAVEQFFRWASGYTAEAGQPLMLIAGAETGVVVKGAGRGGRNSEFAMRSATHIAGSNCVLLAAGTDGIDGITQSAGAIIDGGTYKKGEALGLNFEEMLANNNSGGWCDSTGSSLVTGHTGINLADVLLLIKA